MLHRRTVRIWTKRLISAVLIVSMLLGLIPQSAYMVSVKAEEASKTEQTYTDDGFTITYRETSAWSNYVNAEITLKNNTDADKSLWKVEFDYDGQLDSIWNGDILSSEGGTYVIGAKTYNSTIAKGQSVTFGFMAHGDAAKPAFPQNIHFADTKNADDDSDKDAEDKDDDTDKEDKTGTGSGGSVTVPGQTYEIPEKWAGLNYALFTSGESNLSFYTGSTSITGSVHTNQDFYFQGGSLKIDGALEAGKSITLKTSDNAEAQSVGSKKEKAEKMEMPDITKEVSAYVKEHGTVYDAGAALGLDTVVVDTPIYAAGNLSINSTSFLGQGIVYAEDSITYNVGEMATPDGARLFIASENGDITLNGSNLSLNAVLYAPNGCVYVNANELNLNGRIIAKQICINGTKININAGPCDFDMLDFLFQPEIDFVITGNKKENRKVVFDVEEILNTEYLVKEATVWSITRDGENAEDDFAIDTDSSDDFHKEMIFRKAGTYNISVTVTTGEVTYTVSKEIVIAKDMKPTASFALSQTYLKRDENGVAKAAFTCRSVSEDGDDIGQRIWTVYYDADNNGTFSEDEASVISDGNETEISFETENVGKYKVVLTAVETFEDTIPKLISDDAYLRDDTADMTETACVFEVGNEAPTANLDIEKSKSADIVFTVGDVDSDTLSEYNAKAEALKEILAEKGIDAKVDAISTSTITAQDSFAWKEYGHYTNDKYKHHITYNEDSIKMLGYEWPSYKDFLYIADDNPGQKVFEFDLQRDETDWHSMEGGGFLFNTTVSDEDNTINGFCILITRTGLKLVEISCDDLKGFRDGNYNWVQHAGRLLQTVDISNLYEEHHFKIVVDSKTISVWDGEKILFDNYVLPEHSESYGFGPITSQILHCCKQRSYFTFKNITMRTMTGSTLSDVVSGYDWRAGASHYVINLSHTEVPELSGDEDTADLAAALIKNQAVFIGLGNETNENQYTRLLNTTEMGGMFLSSENISSEMDSVNNYILQSILSKDYSIKEYITTEDIVAYNDFYQDAENDEIYEQQWEYEYNPAIFTSADGDAEHIVRKESEPITVFENTGAYSVRLAVRDNPAGENDALDEYRLWSDTKEIEKLLIVQTRPVAEVKAEVSDGEGDTCIANVTYKAYDLDHADDDRNGIREEYFYYRDMTDAGWTEGKLPNKLEKGHTYLVKYLVKDVEGSLSFPACAVVKTGELIKYEEPDDTTPPTPYINVAKTEIKVGEEIRIEGYALDDYGVESFEMYIDDEKILDAFGRVIYKASKAGTVTVKAIAVDIGGNRAEKELEITVVDKRDTTAPIAEITSPTDGSELGFNIEIKGTASDETKLKKYTLSYRKADAGEYKVFKESTEAVKEDVLGSLDVSKFTAGTYDILLTAEDEAGNVSYSGIKLYIGEGESESHDLFAVNLSHSRASIGTDVSIQVTLPDDIKEDSLVIYQGDKQIASGTKKASFTYEKAGKVTITVAGTNNAGEEKKVSATCTFINDTDKTAPVAEITAPTIDQTLTEPVEIVGSAYDETALDFWKLEYRMKGDKEYQLIAEGDSAKKNEVLGRLDTTMLMNGQYEVRLWVQDQGGNITRLENDYVVEGELKVGAMHIGFTDITAAMGGTTVSVNRMYDSRNKSEGDFGIGWTLGVSGVKLIESNPITEGYQMVQSGTKFNTRYEMTETVSHDVTVTYGDGTSDRFEITFSPQRKALAPISELTIGYKCVTNQKVKLEIENDTSAFISGGNVVFYDESMYDEINYKLTTEDGEVIYLNSDDGVYKLEDTNGTVINVDKNGYHAQDGRSITFTRDSKGRVSKAEDPNNNVVTYQYDDNGDLVSVTDQADRTVSFTYDKKHNLISITDPMGIAVARNEYDDDGRLVATIDADRNRMEYEHDVDGRSEIIKDRRGNTTLYTYDDNGNVLQTVDAYGNKTTNTYDSYNNLLSTTDANGNTTSFKYDESGNVTSVTAADGVTVNSTYTQENLVSSIKMLDKTVMTMSYDSDERLSSIEDANGNETTYSYSSDGKLTGLADEIGQIQQITYDADGNVASTTNGEGESAAYTYDKDGRCTSVTVSRKEEGNTLTFTSYYSYNSAGDITESIDNAGNVTKYEYDKNGNQTASIDAKGRRVTYTYDELGNMTGVSYPDGTSESYTYDENGNNVSATDRSGLTVIMKYDKLDRMTEMTYADGSCEKYVYDKVGNVVESISVCGAKTTYEYDNLNRNTSVTDAYGNVTTFEYDDSSRLAARIDANGNKTSYEYDDNGNITKTTYADGNSVTALYDARNRVIEQKDQNNNKTSYAYDGADRLTKVTDAYGNSYVYTYDDNGNLTAVTDAKDQTTSYEYDSVGRVSKVRNALGKTMEYSYDETGRVTEYKDYAGTITKYAYDDMDRLIRKTVGLSATVYCYSETGLLTKVITSAEAVTFGYDEYNRLISKTDANGVKLSYTYDACGRLSAFDNGYGKTTYEYDLLDRVTRVVDRNGKATLYEYDSLGNRSAVRNPNGTVVTYTYDACQRLKEECITDANGTQLAKYSYGIGKAGERTSITESDSSGETKITYQYDKLNRLTKETIARGDDELTNEYSYDEVSNRIKKETSITGSINAIADISSNDVQVNEGVTEYTYNALNQLISEVSDGKTKTYTYDANGNLIKQIGENTVDYAYDKENHLLRATIQRGNSVTIESYTYDYEGNRTSKTVNDGETTLYVNDTSGSLSMVTTYTDEDGKEKAYFTRGDSSELLSMESEGNYSWYHYDGHGNVRSLTNDDGVITDSYSYDAYGNLLEKEGDTENEFFYTGEQYNSATGLYYLRARYMNPGTGTFISMDSYQGSIYDPVSLHKYLYANANPVMYTDPSGYFSLAECSIATTIQSTLNSIHQIAGLTKLVKWANAMSTVYDATMEIRSVILGGGSIADVMFALIKGVVVGFMVDGICKTSLGIILKPMMAIFGLGSQVDQIQEAIKSGDPVEIAVRFVQLACMLFGLTSQCFTGDTLVSTEYGLKRIDAIEQGDYVWSENTETGERELKKVLSVSVTETNVLVHVTTEKGTVINTTQNHPFYVEGKGWCAAAELESGDALRTQDGETEIVEGVQIEQLEETVKVYNLEIEDSHTYYVSADEVLVHNECNIDADKIKEASRNHIFSKSHVKDGIMDLGDTEDSIMDAAIKVIKEIDKQISLNNGPLQIRTFINSIKTEIRIYIEDGNLINFDMFKGWSSEIKNNSINWF